MQKETSLQVTSIDSILEDREKEVIMVIKNSNDEYLFIRKHFYPKSTYRLPGGGIEKNEDPLAAIKRECLEEFGQEMVIKKNLGKLVVKLKSKNEIRNFTSYLYLLNPTIPIDLKDDKEHSAHKWLCIEHFSSISKTLKNCEWGDWGKFRSLAIDFLPEFL